MCDGLALYSWFWDALGGMYRDVCAERWMRYEIDLSEAVASDVWKMVDREGTVEDVVNGEAPILVKFCQCNP